MITRWTRAGFSAAVASCGLALLAAAPAALAANPRPVFLTSEPILELSANGGHFAWLQGSTEPARFRVYRSSFFTDGATQLTRTRQLITSHASFGRLVVTGRRAYWQETQGGNTMEDWRIRSITRPFAVTTVAGGGIQCGPGGTDLGPTAGAGTTFIYSTHDLTPDPDCGTYDYADVIASRIVRVSARPTGFAKVVVPGVPGAPVHFPWGRLLAVRGGLIAVVPLPNGGRPSVQSDRVEIHGATTGALVSELLPAGTIRAVSLSSSVAAVLVTTDTGTKRIERYDIESGELIGAVPVHSRVSAIDISGNRIVYQVRGTVRVMRADTGSIRTVARIRPAFPRGVQIEHDWVIWYVSSGGHSRIFQLKL